MMTISIRARPTAFSSTARNGGVNICARALIAASIMASRGKAAGRSGARRDAWPQPAGDSVSASLAWFASGTSDIISSVVGDRHVGPGHGLVVEAAHRWSA